MGTTDGVEGERRVGFVFFFFLCFCFAFSVWVDWGFGLAEKEGPTEKLAKISGW